MHRSPTRLVVSLLALGLLAGFAAAGGDDSGAGRERAEWLKMFSDNSKDVKLRRASLAALEVLGPKKDGILAALIDRLKTEPDEELRQEIAQTLGRMGE